MTRLRLVCALWLLVHAKESCETGASDSSFVQLPRHGPLMSQAEAATPQFSVIGTLEAIRKGTLCQLIQDPSGNGQSCKQDLNCNDPVYLLCCGGCGLGFRASAACSDLSPKCQARKAACEMVNFLVDDANPLAQPALYVAPSTYPHDNVFQTGMGGYSKIVWTSLINFTSLCADTPWLRAESPTLNRLSTYTGCSENGISTSCPKNQTKLEEWEPGEEGMSESGLQMAEFGLEVAGDVMAHFENLGGELAFAAIGMALDMSFGSSEGPPTNPCTYAGSDWGKCVWQQIAQYVERFVASYVAEQLRKQMDDVAFEKMKAYHRKLYDIRTIINADNNSKRFGNASFESDFVEPVSTLRTDLMGDWGEFFETPILPQFMALHLNVLSLALKASKLRTAGQVVFLAKTALCHAKIVLKRATSLVQKRLQSLQGILVQRTHYTEIEHLHGNIVVTHSYHCPYYYPGQYDSLCQDNQTLKDSESICNPGNPGHSKCVYSHDHMMKSPLSRFGQGGCAPWEAGAGMAAGMSWFCHRAKVLELQQRVFQHWIQPIWSWLNITLSLQQALDDGEVTDWTVEDWTCPSLEANLSNASGLEGLRSSCPFTIRTTWDFGYYPSYQDRGTGSHGDLAMWRPNLPNPSPSGDTYYYVGDYCENSHNTDVKWLTGMTLQKRPGHEDALATPTGMAFDWNDDDTHGDHDGGLFTPMCPTGYQAVGSVGEQFLKDHDAKPDHLPSPSNWPNLVCVKEEYTEPVSLQKSRWMWTDHGSGGHYKGTVFVGDVYTAASGVTIFGPCHAAPHYAEDYPAYRLKESVVKWCTGAPAPDP